MAAFIIIVCVFSPLLILWLTYKSKVLNKVGTIVLAYTIGCLLGLSGIIPATDEMQSLQTSIASATIPFAIPLMLFSSDVKSWAKLAPSFIKSLIFALLGSAIAITIGFKLFGKSDPVTLANVGGMLSGLFTGGTANLASLKIALCVDDGTYILVNAYEIAASAAYLLFVIIFGKRILGLFMPDFKFDKNVEDNSVSIENHEDELFLGLFRKDNLSDLFKGLGLTVAIIALGAGVASLFPKDTFQSVFILSISLLSILASLSPKVRNIKRTFEAGTYFILIFSIAVATQVRVNTFTEVNPDLLYMTLTALFGSLLFHILLSTLFRVDSDTTLATSISLICSPPFVPVISGALHNKAIVGPGIAVGLFGYAIGTYFGFGLAKMLINFC
ncbi:MAG: DUF819 family protein [Bacteroidales bacterium]|nr:DUF819 family protein [Bacteroidales bacterium]